jgi:hypothetical protein
MHSFLPSSAELAAVRLPYQQATTAQQALALSYLRQRLRQHFPTLLPHTWDRTLTEFHPDLLLRGSTITLAYADLRQLVQHLAFAPELPILDPPLYGLTALHLAQYCLHTTEIATWALPELLANATTCGPRLYALISRLVWPNCLAQQVVQAWRWDLSSAPPLPLGIPGAGPIPGSCEIVQWLSQLARVSMPLT